MAMVAVSCLVIFLLALSHVRQDGKAARASRSVQPAALSAGAASFPLYYIDTQAAYKYADSILPAAAAPPPSHHHHKRLHSQRALVTGHVYCDTCRNGQLKEPLKGVTIGVICWNGEVEQSFYGITNKLGNFKIKLSGYDVHNRVVKSCRAKLIYSSFNSPCTLPTNLHDGKLGAKLHIKSKTPEKLVLSVGPFAYTRASKSKKCHHIKDTRSISSHKHKHRSASQSHTHSQVQAKNIKNPSCPVFDCKTVSSLSYNLDSELLKTQRKTMSHHVKYKALSPMSRSFEHLSPPTFRRNKEPNPHKNSLIWF